MKVQSLSVVVPGGCPNKCKFCVSDIHKLEVKNQIEKNVRFSDLYQNDYMKRLSFARDNGCNVAILTGDGEPLINMDFLEKFSWMNKGIPSPFRWIEIQTSGVSLNEEKLRFLRNTVGVTTISLSLSDMFRSINNHRINGTPEKFLFDIQKLCELIKVYDFNLRLSLNMTSAYDEYRTEEIFEYAKELGANQITFRVLYSNNDSTDSKIEEINDWICKNRASQRIIDELKSYTKLRGHFLEILPFGASRYAVNGMSVVVDDDCMSTSVDKDVLKYLILRPDCKLYSKWDDLGSILF